MFLVLDSSDFRQVADEVLLRMRLCDLPTICIRNSADLAGSLSFWALLQSVDEFTQKEAPRRPKEAKGSM